MNNVLLEKVGDKLKRRANGDGCLRKHKNGRWEGRIIIGHKENGTPIFKYVSAKTQSEVLQKMRELTVEYSRVQITNESFMKTSDWIDKWFLQYAEPTLKPSTVIMYKSCAQTMKKYIGEIPLVNLKTIDIQFMYNDFKENGRTSQSEVFGTQVADSSVKKLHQLTHEILQSAVKQHIILKNPTDGTTIPKVRNTQMNVFNKDELDDFFKAIEQENDYWYEFFFTAITTGARKGELCALKWTDFDKENGTLHINRTLSRGYDSSFTVGDTKTENSRRVIKLLPSTLKVLEEREKKSYSEWIFSSFSDITQPLSTNTCTSKFKSILRDNNLKDIRFHDLRHTFATHAVKEGVDIKTLSSMLGHTKASFTLDRYTHVTDDMQNKAAEIVGNIMDELIDF